MKIVVPMIILFVCMGLFAPRINAKFWAWLCAGVVAIILLNYGKA